MVKISIVKDPLKYCFCQVCLINKFSPHMIPFYYIIVSLDLKPARILFKIFRNKNLNINTQFKNAYRPSRFL